MNALGLIRTAQKKTTKIGKPFWDFTLESEGKQENFRMWSDVCEETYFEPGEFLVIEYTAGEYRGHPQYTITSFIKKIGLDPLAFAKRSQIEKDDLLIELREILNSTIQNKELREVALKLTSNDRIQTFPAAQTMHHAFVHGLLEHMCRCARLAKNIGPLYPEANMDILMFGSVYHDIGKIYELSGPTSPEYTLEGVLLGHLYLGAVILENQFIECKVDTKVRTQIMHIILSHHGKREYGAPVEPGTLEATLVHHIDMIDSRVNMFLSAHEELGDDKQITQRLWWNNNNPIVRYKDNTDI